MIDTRKDRRALAAMQKNTDASPKALIEGFRGGNDYTNGETGRR